MRAIHIEDVHLLARFAAQHDRNACYDILIYAHAADKYRKRFRRAHPKYGTGSISSLLFHKFAPIHGHTWISNPDTLAAFMHAIDVIRLFKSEIQSQRELT